MMTTSIIPNPSSTSTKKAQPSSPWTNQKWSSWVGYILRHKSRYRRNAKEMIDDSFIFEKIADLRLFEAHADMSTSHKTCSNVSWYLVLDQYHRFSVKSQTIFYTFINTWLKLKLWELLRNHFIIIFRIKYSLMTAKEKFDV